MLEKREFDQDAVRFIRESLSRSGTIFSKLLLRTPLEEGQVFSYLPVQVDADTAKRFDVGGLLTPKDEAEIEQCVAEFVASHLKHSGSAYAIFENPVMRPTDPSARRSRLCYFTCDDAVYLFLPPGPVDLGRVIATVRGVHSWVFGGALTIAKGLRPISDRQQAGPDLLEVLAANTKHILVWAYDREAFLIWTRR